MTASCITRPKSLVGVEGLEPSRLSASEPKSDETAIPPCPHPNGAPGRARTCISPDYESRAFTDFATGANYSQLVSVCLTLTHALLPCEFPAFGWQTSSLAREMSGARGGLRSHDLFNTDELHYQLCYPGVLKWSPRRVTIPLPAAYDAAALPT